MKLIWFMTMVQGEANPFPMQCFSTINKFLGKIKYVCGKCDFL